MRQIYYSSFSKNVHLERLNEFFSPDNCESPLEFDENLSFVFLCFTNRCGSNHLSELLTSNGKYNLAGEDLNWDTVQAHANRQGFVNFISYFNFLTRRLARSNVVLIKLAVQQIELLGAMGVLPQIIDQSSFILVERSDKLDQAISYALAFGTGRFTSTMVGSKQTSEVPFSRDLVNNIMRGFAESYYHFDLFFGRNGLSPVNVCYEQLIDNREATLSYIARRLSLDIHMTNADSLRFQRQTDQVNARWRDAYLNNGVL